MPKTYGSSGGVRLTDALIKRLVKKAEDGLIRRCVHCKHPIALDLKSDSCDACYDLDIVMEAESGPSPSHWMYLFNSQFIEHGAFSNE